MTINEKLNRLSRKVTMLERMLRKTSRRRVKESIDNTYTIRYDYQDRMDGGDDEWTGNAASLGEAIYQAEISCYTEHFGYDADTAKDYVEPVISGSDEKVIAELENIVASESPEDIFDLPFLVIAVEKNGDIIYDFNDVYTFED